MNVLHITVLLFGLAWQSGSTPFIVLYLCYLMFFMCVRYDVCDLGIRCISSCCICRFLHECLSFEFYVICLLLVARYIYVSLVFLGIFMLHEGGVCVRAFEVHVSSEFSFLLSQQYFSGGGGALRYHYWAPLKSREGEEDRVRVETAKREGGGASRRTCAGHKRARSTRHRGDARHHRGHQGRPEEQESNSVPQDTEETHVIIALVRMIERSKRRTRRKFHRASRKG